MMLARVFYGNLIKASVSSLLALSISGTSIAAQEPDIRFGINAAPPFHIPAKLRQQHQLPPGFCDQLVTAVQKQLPDANIEIARLPHIRIRYLMKREENLCFPCLIKRSAYNPDYHFSDTVNLYPPHGIITRQSIADKLTERFGSPLSFEVIARETELGFAQPSGRKYGDIQPVLEKFLINTSRHRAVFGQNASFNLLTMIATGRVDYTVDYEMMLHYYQQLNGKLSTAELVYLPIKEYQQKSVTGAIGCARNDWGKDAIKSINEILPAVKRDHELTKSLDYWLGTDRPES